MPNRYNKEYGRGRFENQERGLGGRYGYGYPRYDDDEEPYFGSGRQQYGGGYSERDPGDEPYQGSYRQGREWRKPQGRGFQRGRGYGESGSYREDLSGSGMFGGGIGGYSGGGYQGYSEEDISGRGFGGYSGGRSGYGGANYGRSYGVGYGTDYPRSESGYAQSGPDRGWWDRASDEVASWFGDEDAERRRERDARNSGEFRGRGPRNYQRSDERIKEDVNDRLTDHAYLDASDIEVEVSNREVTLSGTVDSRYAKRLAEDIAEDVSGVSNVENRIRVSQSNWSGFGTRSTEQSATTDTSTTDRTTTPTGKAAGSGRH